MKVYLDSVSTTSLNEEVKETYKDLLDKYYCNSDALYDDGVVIYEMQEKARKAICDLLNINHDELIFTSGACEANSLAIKGICFKNPDKKHIITSIYEHSSVYHACKQMEEVFGYDVTYLKPHSDGKIHLDDIKDNLRKDTILVSIMQVNNEIGCINDIDCIGEYVKKNSSAYFHSDITQGLAKIDTPLDNVDLASFSAHKIHGLKGSGALVKKKYIELEPIISGGQQEYSMRGGTANALVNTMLAKTLRLAIENKNKYHDQLIKMHDYLIDNLKDIVTINYTDGINTLISITTPLTSEVLLNALNQKGIMISSKSTCGSKTNEENRTLSSMNIDEDHAVRISFDYTNTIEELEYFITSLKEIINKYA